MRFAQGEFRRRGIRYAVRGVGFCSAVVMLVATASAGAAGGGSQAIVNGLEGYAQTSDPDPLQRRLHPKVRGCVDDVSANPIARFILRRVEKQGLPGTLQTREVDAGEVAELEQEARRLRLSMPVAPSHELRLVYDDYTARVFMAPHEGTLRWVLPCPA